MTSSCGGALRGDVKDLKKMFLQPIFWAVLLLSVKVNSWDIAVTAGNRIDFFERGQITKSVQGPFNDLGGLTYDAVHDRLFFIDNYLDTSTIYSYDLKTDNYNSVVAKQTGFVHDLAYDPMTNRIYWTNSGARSIHWKSVQEGGHGGPHHVFMDDFKGNEIPASITVDSCRGHVYWTTWGMFSSGTIQRSHINGTTRETVMDTNLENPNGLVIDQLTGKLFWIDTTEDDHYFICESDLLGRNRETLLSGFKNVPMDLTVSKHSLFWVDEWAGNIWKIKKNAKNQFPNVHKEVKKGSAIVANYKISEQTEGVSECEDLRSMDHHNKHSIKMDSVYTLRLPIQETAPEVPIISNHRRTEPGCLKLCLNGDCIISAEGKPICNCTDGFIGAYCEFSVGYNAANIFNIKYISIFAMVIGLLL